MTYHKNKDSVMKMVDKLGENEAIKKTAIEKIRATDWLVYPVTVNQTNVVIGSGNDSIVFPRKMDASYRGNRCDQGRPLCHE